jgi:hypothetical protein
MGGALPGDARKPVIKHATAHPSSFNECKKEHWNMLMHLIRFRLSILFYITTVILFFRVSPLFAIDQHGEGNIASERESSILPLGLYVQTDDFQDMVKWYRSRSGEAVKLDINNPERYTRALLSSLNLSTANSKDWPPGIWHLSKCAFVFAITGNVNCGNAVKEMILRYAAMTDWRGSQEAPFLESHMVAQIVISYDFIYPILGKDERRLISDAVKIKGLVPIINYLTRDGNWLYRSGPLKGYPGYLQNSNQGASFLGAMYLGSRLLYNETKDKKYLDDAISAATSTRILLDNYFSEDGGVTAATEYYLRSLEEISYVIKPMARSLGMSVEDFLPQSARDPFIFAQYLFSNSRVKDVDPEKYPYLIAFGDSSFGSFVYDPIQKHQISNRYYSLALWSSEVKAPNILWLYEHFVNGINKEFNESALSLTSHYYRYKNLRGVHASQATRDKEKIFRSTGLCIWRDGFRIGEKLFAIWKRVYKRGDHLHNDQNTFLLEAFGDRYFTDLGIDYATNTSRGYTKSINNNGITIGRRDNYDGFNRREIFPYLTTDMINYLRSDASFVEAKGQKGIYTPRNIPGKDIYVVRSVIYMKPDYYVIIDSVGLNAPDTVENNFISGYPFTLSGDGMIKYYGSRSMLYQYSIQSEECVIDNRDLIDSHGERAYGVTIRTKAKVRQVDMINVLFPKEKDGAPTIRKKINDSCIRVEIISGQMKDVIIKKKPGYDKALTTDIVTDCEVCVIRYKKDEIVALGFFGGRVLELNGRVAIKADNSTSFVCEPHTGGIFGKASTKKDVLVTFTPALPHVTFMLTPNDEFGNCSFGSSSQ